MWRYTSLPPHSPNIRIRACWKSTCSTITDFPALHRDRWVFSEAENRMFPGADIRIWHTSKANSVAIWVGVRQWISTQVLHYWQQLTVLNALKSEYACKSSEGCTLAFHHLWSIAYKLDSVRVKNCVTGKFQVHAMAVPSSVAISGWRISKAYDAVLLFQSQGDILFLSMTRSVIVPLRKSTHITLPSR